MQGHCIGCGCAEWQVCVCWLVLWYSVLRFTWVRATRMCSFHIINFHMQNISAWKSRCVCICVCVSVCMWAHTPLCVFILAGVWAETDRHISASLRFCVMPFIKFPLLQEAGHHISWSSWCLKEEKVSQDTGVSSSLYLVDKLAFPELLCLESCGYNLPSLRRMADAPGPRHPALPLCGVRRPLCDQISSGSVSRPEPHPHSCGPLLQRAS